LIAYLKIVVSQSYNFNVMLYFKLYLKLSNCMESNTVLFASKCLQNMKTVSTRITDLSNIVISMSLFFYRNDCSYCVITYVINEEMARNACRDKVIIAMQNNNSYKCSSCTQTASQIFLSFQQLCIHF
jgi:hypothetical protein